MGDEGFEGTQSRPLRNLPMALIHRGANLLSATPKTARMPAVYLHHDLTRDSIVASHRRPDLTTQIRDSFRGL